MTNLQNQKENYSPNVCQEQRLPVVEYSELTIDIRTLRPNFNGTHAQYIQEKNVPFSFFIALVLLNNSHNFLFA